MKSTLVLFLSFLFLNSYSQDTVLTSEDEKVYMNVEVPPVFIGSIDSNSNTVNKLVDNGMYKFIAMNINYPREALINGIQGRVIISFVVTKDGSLKDIKVLKGVGYGLDEEALRIVRLMNKSKMWKPGEKDGKPVNVSFILPISFKQ